MNPNDVNLSKFCQEDDFNRTLNEWIFYFRNCVSVSTKNIHIDHSSQPTTGYVIYYFILVFYGIILNLLVTITIFCRNRLRTVPNAFMVSLSMADFLMATVAVPLRIIERLDNNKEYIMTSFLFPCIGVASIFSLCCVTFDRYMHIRHPLNYEKYMNKKRAIIIIAGLWFFSILQASVFFLIKNNRQHEAIYNDVRFGYCFVIPAIFIIITYTKLFFIAKSHARVIATNSVTVPDRPWSQKKDFKILKVIALIVGTFILCWFPFLFAICYELHVPRLNEDFYLFFGIVECFACSTCVLNPIIYGLMRRDLRISMRYVAACKRETIEESESL